MSSNWKTIDVDDNIITSVFNLEGSAILVRIGIYSRDTNCYESVSIIKTEKNDFYLHFLKSLIDEHEQ